MTMPRRLLVLGLATAVALACRTAGMVTVVGVALDSASRSPVAMAAVSVLTEQPATTTDSAGAFTLALPDGGQGLPLYINGRGYAPFLVLVSPASPRQQLDTLVLSRLPASEANADGLVRSCVRMRHRPRRTGPGRIDSVGRDSLGSFWDLCVVKAY